MMDNKFLEIQTDTQGKMLLSAQYWVGLIEINSETQVTIPCLEEPDGVSNVVIYFGAGSTVQTNATRTRQIFHDALNKLYSTSYTENIVELKWPDTVINGIVVIV